MTGHPRIVLRYFDARGRAQFVRYYLRARDIAHEDERVPLSADFSEWQAIRDDTSVSGPFKKLPVLHYGDETVAEALVIASFLHERLGDADLLSAQQNLRHAMLLSSLNSEIMHQVGILLWADLFLKGVEVPSLAKLTLERVRRHLQVLDERLEDWRWVDAAGSRPLTLADCLLWDQLRTASDLFGPALGLAEFATLDRFYRDSPGRASFLELIESHPCQISGRPGEPEAVAMLKGYLGSTKTRRENS